MAETKTLFFSLVTREDIRDGRDGRHKRVTDNSTIVSRKILANCKIGDVIIGERTGNLHKDGHESDYSGE